MIAQAATVRTRLAREALAYSAGEQNFKGHGSKCYEVVFKIVTWHDNVLQGPMALGGQVG